MRAVVMFLAAATLARVQANKCPPYDVLDKTVYLAHQHNCSLFRMCLGGREVPGQCPPGQHFSPSTSTCEDPATAGCTAKLKPCSAGKPQEKCRYMCSCTVIQDRVECPTTLEFPTRLGVFLWIDPLVCTVAPEDINIGRQQLGRLTTRHAIAKTRLCPKIRPARRFSTYRHFADCNKIVHCKDTRESVGNCDPGLVFNPEVDTCDVPAPADVGCDKKPTPVGGCPTTRPLSSCSYTCDCNVTLGKCPAQLRYNATINIVDSATYPDCRADPSLIDLDRRFYGSLQVDTRSAMVDHCPPEPDPLYVPDLLRCGSTYYCSGGSAQTFDCPDGSQYDTRTHKCEHNLSTCRPAHRPTLLPHSLPPQCPVWVSCEGSDGARVRHPTSCTLFCECMQGAPYLGACPPGLHFKELTRTCELPWSANCQARCSELSAVKGGRWHPPKCATVKSIENTKCKIKCNTGRLIVGSDVIRCTSSGWYSSYGLNNIPSCNTIPQVAGNITRMINKVLTEAANAMLFMMDESGSVQSNSFQIMKEFVESVVTAFPLSQERSAGVITFSGEYTAISDIWLNQISTCDFISQLRNIYYEEGYTDLASALELASDEIDHASSLLHRSITALVFVITDGVSKTDPTKAAKQLRDDGHIVLTIGVANYSRAQLEPISSENKATGAKLFYGLKDLKGFEAVVADLQKNYGGSEKLSCP